MQGTDIKNQCLESFQQNDIVILSLSNLIKKNQGLYFVLDILNSFFSSNSFLAFFFYKSMSMTDWK